MQQLWWKTIIQSIVETKNKMFFREQKMVLDETVNGSTLKNHF